MTEALEAIGEEIFKPIPGLEGFYEVSNLGNIKSLGNGKGKKEKILVASKNSRGRLCVNLKGKTLQVHQLVAIAFLNHKLCGQEIIVDHIDNNPFNNRLDNLQLITQRQNISRSIPRKHSKYPGVKKSGRKWVAAIYINSYETEEEAYAAYQATLAFIEANILK